MKTNRQETIAKIAFATCGIAVIIAAVAKPLPDVPKETTAYEVETETETIIAYTMEKYLDEKASEANAQIIQRVEELHTTQEETTQADTWKPFSCIPMSAELQQQIRDLCIKYEIDYTFFIGWCYTESGCRWVIGAANDTGYMQIIPEYHEAAAAAHGIDIYTDLGNCEYAMILLNDYLEKYDGDLDKALQHYNTGNPDTTNGYAETVYKNVEYIRNEQ